METMTEERASFAMREAKRKGIEADEVISAGGRLLVRRGDRWAEEGGFAHPILAAHVGAEDVLVTGC